MKESHMRRFQFHRDVDETGISGTGVVAEGVEFTGGRVVIHWMTVYGAINMYDNITVAEELHGHGGKTRIVYLDE